MKQQLAEIAQKKREEIIKNFYEEHKSNFKHAAEAGYGGYSIKWNSLDEDVKMALALEENRLSEIITEVDLIIVKKVWRYSKEEFIDIVVFNW